MAALLDPGTYRARATEAALGTTSKEKPQVAVRFDLLDFPGQSITWFGYFTDNTTNSTFRALRTAGWEGADLSDLSDLSNPENPEVLLVIEHDTYEGKTTAKVRWVNSAGGLSLKSAMQGDQAKAFAAQMRDRLAAYDAAQKQAGGGKPAPKAKPAPNSVPQDVLDAQAGSHGSHGNDDEIPF